MITPQIFFLILLVLGCLAWIWAAIVAQHTARTLPRLIDRNPAPAGQWPKLSVIVVAGNDVGTIGATCQSLLTDGYPNLEVLLVDDRSSDGTSALINHLATQDSRVHAFNVVDAPPDAVRDVPRTRRAIAALATGDWLLFLDPDVLITEGALRHAVSWAIAEEHEHVVLLPDIRSEGMLQGALLAATSRSYMLGQRPGTLRPVERSDFATAGAFELLRSERVASIGPAKGESEIKVLGDTIVAHGTGMVSVAWREASWARFGGLAENPLSFLGFSLRRAAVAVPAFAFVELAPWLCFAFPGITMRVVGIVGVSCLVTCSLASAWWLRRPLLPAVLAPLGTFLFVGKLTSGRDRRRRRGLTDLGALGLPA